MSTRELLAKIGDQATKLSQSEINRLGIFVLDQFDNVGESRWLLCHGGDCTGRHLELEFVVFLDREMMSRVRPTSTALLEI